MGVFCGVVPKKRFYFRHWSCIIYTSALRFHHFMARRVYSQSLASIPRIIWHNLPLVWVPHDADMFLHVLELHRRYKDANIESPYFANRWKWRGQKDSPLSPHKSWCQKWKRIGFILWSTNRPARRVKTLPASGSPAHLLTPSRRCALPWTSVQRETVKKKKMATRATPAVLHRQLHLRDVSALTCDPAAVSGLWRSCWWAPPSGEDNTGLLVKMTVEKAEELGRLIDQDAFDKFIKSLQ